MNIQIVSYNIHKGFNSLGNEFVLHQMKSLLQQSKTDLLFLQEIVGENLQHANQIKNWPTETQFEFIADSYWPHFAYGRNAVYPERHHGNAILSRFPILEFQNIDLTINKLEMRGLLHCRIQPNGQRSLHLLNVHLDLLHGSRMQQLHQISRYIQTHLQPSDALILAGDFNDWSQKLSLHFSQLLQLNEAFLGLQGQHAKTFPAFFPMLSLDRIYYRHLRPLQAKVFKTQPWSSLSDHLPIFCNFELD